MAAQHFIAAAADPVTRTVSLVRADCQPLVLPFSFFEPTGDGTTPDFAKVRVTDFGRTVAFGPYEASADAILYEVDPDYRKELNRRRKSAEKTFGAALYRLRKQKKLRRSDFAPLSPKTVARIERNEIGKPHGRTLQTLADRLGVPPDEIATYSPQGSRNGMCRSSSYLNRPASFTARPASFTGPRPPLRRGSSASGRARWRRRRDNRPGRG